MPGKYACLSSFLETPSKQILHIYGSSAPFPRQVGTRESNPGSSISHPVLSSHTGMKLYKKFVEFFSYGGLDEKELQLFNIHEILEENKY